MAIAGKHASLPFNVALSHDERDHIARLLVELNHTISDKNLDQFINGELNLKLNDINLKRKTKWDCDIRPLSQPPNVNSTTLQQANKRTLNSQPSDKQLNFYACPKCKHKEASNITQFHINDLDIKLKCAKCLEATPVKCWNCECDKQWHMCPLQGNIDALCDLNLKTIKKVDERSEVKRASSPSIEPKIDQEYRQLPSGDLKMERKRNATWTNEEEAMRSELFLGTVYHHRIPSNLLGPTLKKRFKRIEQV